jgi:hypothetical protein
MSSLVPNADMQVLWECGGFPRFCNENLNTASLNSRFESFA